MTQEAASAARTPPLKLLTSEQYVTFKIINTRNYTTVQNLSTLLSTRIKGYDDVYAEPPLTVERIGRAQWTSRSILTWKLSWIKAA